MFPQFSSYSAEDYPDVAGAEGEALANYFGTLGKEVPTHKYSSVPLGQSSEESADDSGYLLGFHSALHVFSGGNALRKFIEDELCLTGIPLCGSVVLVTVNGKVSGDAPKEKLKFLGPLGRHSIPRPQVCIGYALLRVLVGVENVFGYAVAVAAVLGLCLLNGLFVPLPV